MTRQVTGSGVLQAAGTLAGVATVAGFLSPLHWTLDLFAHFRFQYALGLAVVAALLLLLRMWRSAVLYSAFCLLNVWLIVPLYIGGQAVDADRSAGVVRVLTQNVNTHHGDPQQIAELLLAERADLVALQEIDDHWLPMLDGLTDVYPYRRIVSRSDNFGIALLSIWPFDLVETIYPADGGLPSIRADVRIGARQLRVIATHPPPQMNSNFAQLHQNILNALAESAQTDLPVVVLGDLNTTRWSSRFSGFLESSGLADSASGYGFQPTWTVGLLPLLIPIDHVLYSRGLLVRERKTGPQVGSDHRSVIVDLQWTGLDL